VCVLLLWLWEIGKGTSDVGSLCTRNVCSSDQRENVAVTVNCNCVNVYECAIMLRLIVIIKSVFCTRRVWNESGIYITAEIFLLK
jgi:hypothetical protein